MFYLFSLVVCFGYYCNCMILVVDLGFIKGWGDLLEYCKLLF